MEIYGECEDLAKLLNENNNLTNRYEIYNLIYDNYNDCLQNNYNYGRIIYKIKCETKLFRIEYIIHNNYIQNYSGETYIDKFEDYEFKFDDRVNLYKLVIPRQSVLFLDKTLYEKILKL
jgi:hypothetical protein